MMKKEVVIIGAGLTGRGMLGELYHADGFHIIFADNDSRLVEGLRRQGWYTVKMSNMAQGTSRESRIDDFAILDTIRDHTAYIDALCRTSLISTALMPDAFDQVIEDLAEMTARRRAMGIDTPQFITLGANFVGLYEYFDQGLRKKLAGEDLLYFQQHIHLTMSIVNRKNKLPDAENTTDDAYRIIGDDKSVLRVEDSSALRALPILPGFFRPEQNLSAAMAIKIWSGNVVQCSMAFVALHYGIENTYDAAFHPVAARYAYYAAAESYGGVSAEYGLPPRSSEEAAAPVTIFRTKALQDSLYRIVREPIRKLGRHDRFIGPALLALKHGILPYYICRCCAYAFLYRNENDPQSLVLQDMLAQKGIEETVKALCGLDIQNREDKLVFDLIVSAYRDVCELDPLV